MNGKDGQNGRPPEVASVLWAWVAEQQGETGVARLQTAWIPLGTINLVGFSKEVLTDPKLVEALQEQTDRDGQTVRLVRFHRSEEVLEVRPNQGQAPGRGEPWVGSARPRSLRRRSRQRCLAVNASMSVSPERRNFQKLAFRYRSV